MFQCQGSQARAYSPQRHGVLLYRVTHKGFLIVFRMSRWARSKGEACTSSPRRHSLFLLDVTFVCLLRKPNRFGRLSLLELFSLHDIRAFIGETQRFDGRLLRFGCERHMSLLRKPSGPTGVSSINSVGTLANNNIYQHWS